MLDACPFCRAVPYPDSHYCHRCGFPLKEAIQDTRKHIRHHRWALILIGLAIASVLIGWLICLLVVESIVVSGWFIAGTGIGLVILGSRLDRWLIVALGAAQVGLCVAVFLLINFLSWSPGEAHWPVSLIGTGYVLLAGYAYYRTWEYLRSLKTVPDWICRHCGYLLIGLTTNRCPECGTVFRLPEAVSGQKGGA